jgi:hypothetical protein
VGTPLLTGVHTIVASYAGDANYLNSNGQYSQTVGLPIVNSVVINGNLANLAGPQRSRVASLQVNFDQPVQLDTNAMTLALHTKDVVYFNVVQPSGFGALPTSLVLSTTDNITWIVTFSGNTDAGLDGIQSLKDGVYDFKIDATKVHPLGIASLNAAASSTTTFHRLFGDTNAPETPPGGVPGLDFFAIVNADDNLMLRGAFNNAATYNASLDFNGDGVINSGDNLQFRKRFGKALSWRV